MADNLVSFREFEDSAARNLSKAAYDYYRAGANASFTLKENEEAFSRMHLKTSLFARKADLSLTTTIMGHKVKSPIAIASTAFHRMAHPDGELATARAANAFNGTTLKLSSWSTTTLEEVAAQAPDSLKFFQIYLSKIPEVNLDLFARVKQAGYQALHLTIDTQILGKRENDVRNNFQLPAGLAMANYSKYLNTHGAQADIKSSGQDSGLAEYVKNHKDANIGWDVIPKLKAASGLPVVAKGIMCAEDALLAL
jgi:(S)-2-hydroxy-acid oxidase